LMNGRPRKQFLFGIEPSHKFRKSKPEIDHEHETFLQ
jgi:hypothetical protein